MALRVTGYLGLDGSGFFQTMTRADAAVKRFSSGVGSALTSRFAALFSAGAVGYAIKQTVDYAGKLTDLAGRTGATVEELQRFDQAAKQNGSSLENLIAFWERLDVARNKALRSPSGREAAAFKRFGIDASSLTNSSAQDITRQIAVAFKNSTNVEEFVAPLVAIGGRGAMELAEAFATGMDQAYDHISVMSAEQADMLDEIGDSWAGMQQELTARLAPAIIWVIDEWRKLSDSLVVSTALIKGFSSAVIEAARNSVSNPKNAVDFAANPLLAFLKHFFPSSSKAWKEIDDVTVGVMKEREEQRERDEALRRQRIERRRKRGVRFSAFDDEDKITQAKITPLMNDSLIRTGNFLGTNRNVLETVAMRQVHLLTRIEHHTKKMADKQSSGQDDLGIPE